MYRTLRSPSPQFCPGSSSLWSPPIGDSGRGLPTVCMCVCVCVYVCMCMCGCVGVGVGVCGRNVEVQLPTRDLQPPTIMSSPLPPLLSPPLLPFGNRRGTSPEPSGPCSPRWDHRPPHTCCSCSTLNGTSKLRGGGEGEKAQKKVCIALIPEIW